MISFLLVGNVFAVMTDAECAQKAKNFTECNKSEGCEWNGNECVAKIALNEETDKDTEYELNNKIPKVSCGSGTGMITGIPKKIPELTSTVVTIIYIAIPVILVLLGSIDLFKGIAAGKEDEMKKGQKMFVKRLVTAAIVFFVVVIIKFVISLVADTNTTNIVDCIDCFVSNSCKEE